MMAGNPNSWWSINNNTNSMQNLRTPSRHEQQPTPHDPSPTLLSEQQQQTTTSLFPPHEHHQYVHGSDHDSLHHQYHNHVGCHEQVPISWNPVFLGGFVNEEERYGQPTAAGHHNNQSRKLLEENCSWETQQYLNNISPRISTTAATLPRQDHHHIKEEVMTQQSSSNLLYNNHHQHHEDQDVREDQGGAATYRQLLTANWPHTILPASPKSCVTSLSSGTTNTAVNNNNNILDFSNNKRLHRDDDQKNNQHADHSYECNSTAATTGGVAAAKKTRVQPSSTPPLKVRKEKLGDRITALHQLVSPFGKTDTASVLLEAIGYIRFLQGQIEQALSSPYLGSSPAKTQQQSAHGERNCLFPNHPGQLLNDSRLKRRGGAANQDYKDKEGAKDLKSRGLCLVPISCSHLVGNDNGADYWAPSFGGGF